MGLHILPQSLAIDSESSSLGNNYSKIILNGMNSYAHDKRPSQEDRYNLLISLDSKSF